MEIITLITGFLFIGLGFLAKAFPGLIAGYNTMSKEKKKKVDIEGLTTYMRNGFIIIGSVIIAGYYIFRLIGLDEIANIVMLISILGGVIILVIGAQKYDHNENKNKKSLYIILIVIVLFIAGMMIYSSRPSHIIIENNIMKISGSYGFDMDIAEISEIELRETIPAILSRTNGYSYGSVKKGYFKLEEYGKTKLFLHAEKGPFILITDKEGNKTIINYKDTNETEDLYNNLKSFSE